MTQAVQISPVIGQLETILGSGTIAAPYDRWGARLLAHLTRPVRVVVTGFEGSGKSALIEMLSGRPVLGHDCGVPIIELAYGDTARVLFERQDGSLNIMAGHLKDHTSPEGTVRVRQELADAALLRQNFIELGLSGPAARKSALLEEAVSKADIIIWCTQDFGETEQVLWSSVPDGLKDHALLALTMADRQMMRGVLSDTIARLEPVVAEEFLGLFPVATIQGITARTSADEPNQAQWAACGGKYIADLLAKQVTQGRAADTDRAQVFLDRLSARLPACPAQATPELRDASTPVLETAPRANSPADAETNALLTEAIDLLQRQASKMIEATDTETLDPDAILHGCTETMSALSHLLDSAPLHGGATDALRADLEEGEELLMLFNLERGEDAALDAVTLLLQMRKEFIAKDTES
jgi:hypothetical protein